MFGGLCRSPAWVSFSESKDAGAAVFCHGVLHDMDVYDFADSARKHTMAQSCWMIGRMVRKVARASWARAGCG